MSAIADKKVKSPKTNDNNILKQCTLCQKSFVEKYWDDELDWYIDVNLTSICRQCQSKEKPTS